MAHQVLSWRRSAGERRQQLKWLASGAAITLVLFFFSQVLSTSVMGQVLGTGLVALPVSIGVGILTLAPGAGDLPPDVARSWDRIRRLNLQMLAGAALDGDLPGLAQDLIGELEERRGLILTSRTFAQTRRTYDSLAAELGVGRERVRQLETSALRQLAGAAAHDRYRPLRWRAASAAQFDRLPAAVIPGAPPWLYNMLSWLSGQPA